ncbi:MAG: DUF938 domain-containing protein [Parvularculaceae bacterium]
MREAPLTNRSKTGPAEKQTALEERGRQGARLFSPSTARNRDPICAVFLEYMPTAGTILEIGSGTGEHAVHLAASLPNVRWLPGDPDQASRASIAAWIETSGLDNVAAPHAIDVTVASWAGEVASPVAGVVSINMIHIAPFDAARGLIAGAGALLGPGGKLFLYGPFSRAGHHTAPSNAEFDKSLKERDPRWGVRDLEHEVAPIARDAGLVLEKAVEMPANNFSVIFKKSPGR